MGGELRFERRTGFVLTLDELQLVNRTELALLTSVLQEGTEEAWPMLLIGAGLFAMREPAHSVTYSERGERYDIGLIDQAETRRALAAPAKAAGRPMDDVAAGVLGRASGGYPYAIQVFGQHAWRASAGRDSIDETAARAALKPATAQLERPCTGPGGSRHPQASSDT